MKTCSLILATAAAVALGAGFNAKATNCCAGCNTDAKMTLAKNQTTAPAEHGEHKAHNPDKSAKVLQAQTTCPIMTGNSIDQNLFVDHEGKRIYVCCAGCLDAVKAEPEAAIAKLAEQGQAPGQALCPFMQRPIDPKRYVDHEGERVYVCCGFCLRRAKANPAAAVEKLRKQGIAPTKAGDDPAAAAKPNAHEHHQH